LCFHALLFGKTDTLTVSICHSAHDRSFCADCPFAGFRLFLQIVGHPEYGIFVNGGAIMDHEAPLERSFVALKK
jgi:hypothetical protein